ncbi:CPS_HP_G0113900.mRNA.1.CDS.1 [Saccharomyces cerevisiae]|nr:CPS_HP_G0014940.mRNA.1.CDS.1 [Saccharomyces cerevisiae]CAI5060999.1 CPS_HP_G0113900.mRNA.1.CDS.1 [Saccharomyces cerevisiae]CAI6410697.1 CPS_HP_G0014940.mRNA.1.CDS.1 [Saccharomyces cerevisiae]CAI6961614.1 CPS_HP_G0113900.mRNA.1.CDS.1 [Saccharomyces cerevisiae]CAI7224462.1 CPS_collapsed_G0012720.mRNA.1.CDS.1 [Saccharomyces cerevisiae]
MTCLILWYLWLISTFQLEFATASTANTTTTAKSGSSSSTEDPFPVLAVGKDGRGNYYVNSTFGTPGQRQRLLVDIIQPYINLVSGTSESHNEYSSVYHKHPSYLMNDSTSSVPVSPGQIYEISFIDGRAVNCTLVTDDMNFTNVSSENSSTALITDLMVTRDNVQFDSGSLSISNVSFFDIQSSNFKTSGLLGLSGKVTNPGNAIDSSQYTEQSYFLSLLKDADIIESSSYSLWLAGDTSTYKTYRDPISNCGKLLLGGVNPSLFTGTLGKFDLIPYVDPVSNAVSVGYPIVPLGPIYIVSNSGQSLNMTSKDFLSPALLDSTSSVSYLPTSTIIQIAVQIAATYVESLDRWLVQCSIADMGVSLGFKLRELTIEIPLRDLLSSTYDTSTNSSMFFSSGQEACFLTLYANTNTGVNILGEAFMKNIYMAMDLEDNTIAIAQAKKVEDDAVTEETNETTTSTIIKKIKSGYIPYAKVMNSSNTRNLTLYPSYRSGYMFTVPGQLTAAYSNGVITGAGRSFYDTSRASTSARPSSSQFDSFSVSASEEWSNSTNRTSSASGAGVRLSSPYTFNKDPAGHVTRIASLLLLSIFSILIVL